MILVIDLDLLIEFSISINSDLQTHNIFFRCVNKQIAYIVVTYDIKPDIAINATISQIVDHKTKRRDLRIFR